MLSPDILDPRLHEQAAAVLKKLGRVHIPAFLEPEVALILHASLARLPWSLRYREGERDMDLPVATFAALKEDERGRFLSKLYRQATTGYQYFYENYAVSSRYEKGERAGPLEDFYLALNTPQMLNYLRALTGDQRVAYVDVDVAAFRPGHFRTADMGQRQSTQRICAYELTLTPEWQSDWGGQLMFIRPDGHVAEAYAPRFNALNVFKATQPQAVSIVAPFAPAVRYAISGWIRADRP